MLWLELNKIGVWWAAWCFLDSGDPVFWWRDRMGLCRERGARMGSGSGLCVRSWVKGPDDRVGRRFSVVCRPRGEGELGGESAETVRLRAESGLTHDA